MSIDNLIYYKLRGYNDSNVLYSDNIRTKILLLHNYQAIGYHCKNLFIILNENPSITINHSEITYHSYSKKTLTFPLITITLNICNFDDYNECIKLIKFELSESNRYRNNAIDFERNELTDKIINGCSYYLK